jgi:hypothetical protein
MDLKRAFRVGSFSCTNLAALAVGIVRSGEAWGRCSRRGHLEGPEHLGARSPRTGLPGPAAVRRQRGDLRHNKNSSGVIRGIDRKFASHLFAQSAMTRTAQFPRGSR